MSTMQTGVAVRKISPESQAELKTKEGIALLVLLCLGHFFVDLYSSAVGALQPFLVDKLKLSLTQVGVLGGLFAFASSVTQPLYGYLADRWKTPLFTGLGPALAGVFISCLGLASAFSQVLIMLVLGGVGIAMFHPQASAWATRLVPLGSKGRAMAFFISGGALGFALGPTVFNEIVSRTGLESAYLASIPAVFVSGLLVAYLWNLPFISYESRVAGYGLASLRPYLRPLLLLFLLVYIRSIIHITFTQMLPLYFHLERGSSISVANYVLTLYLVGGVLGALVGGYLADKIGGKQVIFLSMILSPPVLLVFFVSKGWLSLLALFVSGVVLLSTVPVNVLMGQQLVPEQAGTVSALMMGFAWGSAGLMFVPLVGWVSDRLSLHVSLASLMIFPVIGAYLAKKIPDR